MLTQFPQVRVVLYALAILTNIASFFVVIYSPELAQAFVSTSALLTTAAGAVAITNVNPEDGRL
jgi:hypothetical protein